MKKVLQRTGMAKRQANRKLQLFRNKVKTHEEKQYKREVASQKAELNKIKKQARIARKEDWELGPLAPRRDTSATGEVYGAMNIQSLIPPKKAKSMKPKAFNVVTGDRVVIVQGLDKGKIGVIRDVQEDGEYAFIDGLRMTDFAVPEWQRKADQDPRPFRSIEGPISLSELRLIFPMKNPKTGATRDVVVEEIGIRRLDGKTKERIIPGTDVVIPWPEKTDPEEPKNDDDTTLASVEERTWIPELLTSPLPEGVIDELRNPFSRFRDRHDDEYIASKESEDDVTAFVNDPTRNHMRTPLEELRILKQREHIIRGPQPISDDILARIGEAMIANSAQKA